jgi:hypothetical protein
MPIVLIIVGLAVALGVGSYFLRPQDVIEPVTTETVIPNEVADGITVPTEATDTPETNTAPLEAGDAPQTETVPVTTTTEKPTETTTVTTTPAPTVPTTPATTYTNGAHTVNTAYTAPGNANHTMAVTLTLKDDIVTASSITFGGDKVGESSKYQNRFMSAYQSQVIGKKLDAIKLSRVGGASLTTGGFNDAIAKVKATASN